MAMCVTFGYIVQFDIVLDTKSDMTPRATARREGSAGRRIMAYKEFSQGGKSPPGDVSFKDWKAHSVEKFKRYEETAFDGFH
jgi:hypothetical protein